MYADASRSDRKFDSDLGPAELQDHAIGGHAIGVPQANTSGAAGKCATSADRSVGAFNGLGAPQVEGLSNKLGGRGANRATHTYARDSEWIMRASKRQHALAAANTEDKAALGKHDSDRSGFRMQCCADDRQPEDAQKASQSSMWAGFSHDVSPTRPTQ